MWSGSAFSGPSRRRAPIVGAGAGMFTVLWFTILHQIAISDIWFSFGPMLAAGALCGSCLAWNHDLLFEAPSPSTWTRYVSFHLASLLLLGAASVALFDPLVPMSVVVAANEPPMELIRRAMPLTAVSIGAAGALASVLWGRTPRKIAANLLSSTVLITLLGLNVSALGLVELSSESVAVVGAFLGLIILIMAGYGLAFLAATGAVGSG